MFWMRFLFYCAGRAQWFMRLSEPVFIRLSRVAFRDALRRGPRLNAGRLLPPQTTVAERERFVDQVLRSFYRFIYEVGRGGRCDREAILAQVSTVVGREHYEQARSTRRGVIVATAHLGSFEVGMAALRNMEPKVHVVFQRDAFSSFDQIRAQLHRRLDVVDAPVEDGPNVWIRLRDALQADEAVLIQADRVMPGQKGVAVPFLGGHLEMPLGPVKLARISGAPILPVFAVRDPDRRIRLIIEPAIEVGPGEESARGGQPSRPMLALAATIERQLKQWPEQWLMLQPAWMEDQPPRT